MRGHGPAAALLGRGKKTKKENAHQRQSHGINTNIQQLWYHGDNYGFGDEALAPDTAEQVQVCVAERPEGAEPQTMTATL